MSCDLFQKIVDNSSDEEKQKMLEILQGSKKPEYRVDFEIWDNGSLKSITEYLGNKKNGLSIHWYSNGKKECDRFYHSDKRHGKYILRHKNGKLKWEGNYREGRLCSSTEWDEDGNIM